MSSKTGVAVLVVVLGMGLVLVGCDNLFGSNGSRGGAENENGHQEDQLSLHAGYWYQQRANQFVEGQFVDPALYEPHRVRLSLYVKHVFQIDVDDLVNGDTFFSLVPPENIEVIDTEDRMFTKDEPLTTLNSDGPPDIRDYGYWSSYRTDGGLNYQALNEDYILSALVANLSSSNISGVWTFERDDELVETFDLHASAPTDEDGRIVVPIPNPSFSFNDEGHLDRIEIMFDTWDANAGEYVEMTDYGYLDQARAGFEMRDYGETRVEERWTVEPPFEAGIVIEEFDNEWHLEQNADTTGYPMRSFYMSLDYAGISYIFNIRVN